MATISMICVTEVDETPEINQGFSSGKGVLMVALYDMGA
jgi:hypothetical protein